MNEKKVAIIGAGLSGLAAGIFARLNGYRAHVFEHANQPGGVSATWRRKDYTIDGGIHFYMGYKADTPTHELFRVLGVDHADQYIPMETYARYRDPAAGHTLDLTCDLDRFADDARAMSPRDEPLIKSLVSGAGAFQGLDLSQSLRKPPELSNILDKTRMMWFYRNAYRYMQGSYTRPIREFASELSHPFLREVVEHIFLPDVPVYFVLMVLGQLADRNIGIRKDGSEGFTRGLEKRLLDLGGEITYKATVTEIPVEEGSAVGLRLEDGREFRADKVISTADGASTLYDMLGGRYITPELKKAHSEFKLFDPCLMLNFGLAREFKNDPQLVVYKPERRPTAGYPANPWQMVRIFNHSDRFAPPGKTLIQVTIDSAWAPWEELRRDKPAYIEEKEILAAQVLESLEELWPGISKGVEMTDVATPYTWWRYTRNREGAYEGFAVTHQSFNTELKRTLPGLDNFVMAGQWISPGGGVIPSLMTGRHAVMLLCREDGKKFDG